jgi:hypothetical protein
MRLDYPSAGQAYVGMKLPPTRMDLGDQYVLAVHIDPKNHLKRRIRTTQGEWEFAWDQLLMFPRRQDGSVIDWRRVTDRVPQPVDIVVGDTLASPEPFPDVEDDDAGKLAKSLWWAGHQVVTKMFHDAAFNHVAIRTYQDINYQTRTWRFHITEGVVFPRFEVRRPNGKSEFVDRTKQYGPYTDVKTGNTHMFFVHPFGRGRWPSHISKFSWKQGFHPDPYFSRPPSSKKDWDQLILARGGDAHPNDPNQYDRARET